MTDSDAPKEQHEPKLAKIALKLAAKERSPLSGKDKLKLRRVMRLFAMAELTKKNRMGGF